MTLTDVTFPGTHSLSELEQFIDQQEEILGPLVNLGNAGPNSVLTFDMSDPPPTRFVVLRTTSDGNSPTIDGFSMVCQGNCLIGSQLTGVAALRSDGGKPGGPSVKPGSASKLALTGELPAANTFKAVMVAEAAPRAIPPAVIAAIGSVESGWGTSNLMQPTGPAGTGDRAPRNPSPPLRPGPMPTDGLGFGRGLMQIDWDFHPFARTGNWQDAAENIRFGCALLAADRDRFVKELGMSADDALMAAIAAYNAGFGGTSQLIREHGLKSAFLPGRYAAKVLARIDFFRSNGFDDGVAVPGAAPIAAAAATAATVAAATTTTMPGGGPYVAPSPLDFLGISVQDGQCVAFVREASKAPHTSAWRRGDLVKGNTAMANGTAIATFDPTGHYGNHTDGTSHAAIYLRQDAKGLEVLDQWTHKTVQPVHQRVIHFGRELPADDGNAFFVIL